jgi:hypothetical protein
MPEPAQFTGNRTELLLPPLMVIETFAFPAAAAVGTSAFT